MRKQLKCKLHGPDETERGLMMHTVSFLELCELTDGGHCVFSG
jgi:hypothetical protein